MPNKNNYADDITALRKRTNMSQRDFANKFEISRRTLQNWEEGINKPNEYRYKYLVEQVERWLNERQE